HFAKQGTNPLKLGFVGATDTHNATAGNVDERNWPGNSGVKDNTPALRLNDVAGQNPGGLTGGGAEENTRESIGAGRYRREVFATSGPRIKVRFYAYTGTLEPCHDAEFPASLVSRGAVPMGGILPPQSTEASLVVYALQDETPLAEVDIVKASVDGG